MPINLDNYSGNDPNGNPEQWLRAMREWFRRVNPFEVWLRSAQELARVNPFQAILDAVISTNIALLGKGVVPPGSPPGTPPGLAAGQASPNQALVANQPTAGQQNTPPMSPQGFWQQFRLLVENQKPSDSWFKSLNEVVNRKPLSQFVERNVTAAFKSDKDGDLQPLAKNVNLASAAMSSFTKGVNIATNYTLMMASAMARVVDSNDTIAAGVMRTKAGFDAVGSALREIPIIGGLLGGFVESLGNLATLSDRKFIELDAAYKRRIQDMRAFSPDVARAAAQGDLAEFQRKMFEGKFLGKQYAELAKVQQQLENVKAAVAVGQKAIDSKAQLERTNDQIAKQLAELETTIANLALSGAANTEQGRQQLQELIKIRKSAGKLEKQENPLDEFLKGVKIPNDPSPTRENLIKEARKRQMQEPIFRGGL